VRLFWLTIGILSLAVGAAGIVLPLVPTTPLVLLAAFAFAQSSQRLHDWIVAHNVFGPLIADWRKYRAIRRRAKMVSVLSMAGVLALSIWLTLPMPALMIQGAVLVVAGAFIVSRPLPPADDEAAE